jgi:hypothetical protein
LSIVVEAEQNPNRAILPLKSRAKNFDGSMVGFRLSSERNCTEKSMRYHDLKSSSGSEAGAVWLTHLRNCPQKSTLQMALQRFVDVRLVFRSGA